ncbi:carbon monoxide dehydrogenase subunit G [Streptomyces sp. JJ66]|uniref:carbon monoxide dehydrogenase subunit G n=1 Tax=Streptomyces sp. JJ66 TaxID=2803843 RepID=UPI001C5A2035|nr:carbon monoxide dehydrogenase subunit G [Streptomyces sp. JJ66]MBW1602318.1 carbon monoxide dehydrogenase subunit G [Streptomyces sp. JJ66]
MEHEVYVPFPVGPVRAALAEPERVARCVPGFQPDASEEPRAPEGETAVTGRLRLRIAGSTITYRGTLAIAAAEDGFHVTGEGTEARGQGKAHLTLTLTPRTASSPDAGAGTALACTGGVRGTGRLTEVEARQRATAGRRLLERFGEALAESLAADPPADDNARVIPGIPAPETPPGTPEPDPAAEPAGDSGFDPPVPASSLDPLPAEEPAGLTPPVPAEAAHARRTMIGRSAEEVDHAPPRGRYAPVPAPETVSTTAALRWAAPAAALALASAVAVTRVLRRRR